jgi:hypothetical protein
MTALAVDLGATPGPASDRRSREMVRATAVCYSVLIPMPRSRLREMAKKGHGPALRRAEANER